MKILHNKIFQLISIKLIQKTKWLKNPFKATNDLLNDRILNCEIKTCEIAVFLKRILKILPKTLVNIKRYLKEEPPGKFPPKQKRQISTWLPNRRLKRGTNLVTNNDILQKFPCVRASKVKPKRIQKRTSKWNQYLFAERKQLVNQSLASKQIP